jgi:hypothetical protein
MDNGMQEPVKKEPKYGTDAYYAMVALRTCMALNAARYRERKP